MGKWMGCTESRQAAGLGVVDQGHLLEKMKFEQVFERAKT